MLWIIGEESDLLLKFEVNKVSNTKKQETELIIDDDKITVTLKR